MPMSAMQSGPRPDLAVAANSGGKHAPPKPGQPVLAGSAIVSVQVHEGSAANEVTTDCRGFLQRLTGDEYSYDLRWLGIVARGLKHRTYLLTAWKDKEVVGVLPLAFVKSTLFGRFLVSLPYVNSAGVIADCADTARALVDRAVQLADELNVRYLELRHEIELHHPALRDRSDAKVLMRLELPGTLEALDGQIKSKVRNKVKKGEKQGFTVHWGQMELLEDFYAVFSVNMRDLGTPVFSRELFRSIMLGLPEAAEFCVIRAGRQPIATALLIHRQGSTEVPSASSLREFNSTNVNDWMYWNLLQRSVLRGQRVFDFGRTTVDSNTFVFKKKWGAEPVPTVWQYYLRSGTLSDMRPENRKFALATRIWQKLPVGLTRLAGPLIVRGIP